MAPLAPGAATMTVLFTDLVGSTATRARLGDDHADRLRREHDELSAQVISDHRGLVVKGLGDGLMAVFHAPSEALAAAVGINQVLSRRNRKAPEPLTVRMGMSIGEVRVEGDDVFGTPVVEASRLCGVAADDQILVSEHVRALVGSRSPVGFAEVGSLDLKGLAEPLAACEATWWEATDAVAMPSPDLPLLDRSAGFVGRKLERFALADAWSRARAGRGPIVVLSGGDAVGKSRLAMAFADAQHDEGALVLAGRCDGRGTDPYQPFVEALRFQVAHLPDAQLREQLGPGAAELWRLLPELGDRLGVPPAPAVEPWVERLRLLDAVVAWLEATARRQPVVLVLDDLHQASPATRTVVEHLARSTAPMRLLVVATWRTGGTGDPGPALDRELTALRGTHRGVEHIPIGPLDPTAVQALVTEVLGVGLDQRSDRLAAALADAAASPGACLATLDALVARGEVASRSGHWSFTTDPDALQVPIDPVAVWADRLDRLEPAARQVLEAAAVVGDEFSAPFVRSVLGHLDAGTDETALLRGLEEAVGAGVVLEPTTTRTLHCFAHPLVATTCREAVEPARRRALHVAVADELERQVGPNRERAAVAAAVQLAAAVAVPGLADDPLLLERAMDLATAAGHRSRTLRADAEAVGWYRLATSLGTRLGAGADYRRLDLALATASAAAVARLPETDALRAEALALARAAADPVGERRAVLEARADLVDEAGAPDPARLAVLLAAVAGGEVTDPAELARCTGHLAVESWGTERDADRPGWALASVEQADRVADPTLRAEARRLALTALADPEHLDHRRRLCDELAGLAQELDDPVCRFRVAVEQARLAFELGDRLGFDAATESARLVGLYLRDPRRWATVLELQAVGAFLDGDLEQARTVGEQVAAYRPDHGPSSAFAGDLGLAVSRLRGELDDEVAGLDDALRRAGGPRRLRLACLAVDAGRVDLARAVHDDWVAAGMPAPVGPGAGAGLVALGTLAAVLADAAAAARLAALLEPYRARSFAIADPLPVTHHALAMLAATMGRAAEANAAFEAAVDAHEAMGAPLLAAESRLEWARFSHAVGEQDRARVLADQVRSAARSHGAGGLEAQARALLVAIEAPGGRFGAAQG